MAVNISTIYIINYFLSSLLLAVANVILLHNMVRSFLIYCDAFIRSLIYWARMLLLFYIQENKMLKLNLIRILYQTALLATSPPGADGFMKYSFLGKNAGKCFNVFNINI